MHVLVLNCGSATLKFQIIDTDAARIAADDDRCLAKGLIERIGSHSLITITVAGAQRVRMDAPLRDHRAAIDFVLRWVVAPDSGIEGIQAIGDIDAVGHRVAHGGERFQESVRIDEKVIDGVEECIELAPLHNPANLRGIRAARELLGTGVPQVAVFDTAFHATMPEQAYLYGIPYQHYRRHKIRRYGFHGTSHRYVAFRYRRMLEIERDDVNIITLHLGNGASACAIQSGKSIDTSMGFTPQAGLLMSTRAGDIDASVLEYLSHKEGMSLAELDQMLNKNSGLLGISGLTDDMRELLEEEAENQDRRARLAIDIFCYRVRKYIGAYFAAMSGADAIVFTGGIGENSPEIRRRICVGLDRLGLIVDAERNSRMSGGELGEITTDDASIRAFVIPTNEELLIARDTVRVVSGLPRPR